MLDGILKKLGADALLVSDAANMRRISGFSGEGLLYISKAKNVIITDSRYTEIAGYESDFEVIEENASHRRFAILNGLIEADKALCVGFEDQVTTYADFNKLKDNLKQVQAWVGAGDSVNELRLVKTDEELALMQKASEIADKAFMRLLEIIKPGLSEKEGAAYLEYQMRLLGADGVSFDTIFAAGKNSSMPHAVSTDYKVRNGDFITIDFGCKYKGYCSDTTRTVAVGSVSEEQREIYGIVLRAHKSGLAAVRPGVTGGEVDASARNIINEAGYGNYFGHATGHGVGLYIHEEPRFSPNVKTVYESGMTGTIEPGIYLPGQFGVRIEDMIAVTDDGCRSFTKLPKEIMIL